MLSVWVAAPGKTAQQLSNALGLIPMLLDEDNPLPAAEQIDITYAHGGGWNKFEGFKVSDDHMTIQYPGDPPHHAVAYADLRDERIIVFDYAWVMIVQKDGSYEIARLD